VSSKFDQIHMETAWAWARFGTCQRLQVGSVLAVDERTVASGYNGAPSGLPHCQHLSDGTMGPDDICKRAVHAESNVIAFAAKEGRSTKGATLYITHSPCYNCSGLLISAGITRVVFHELFRRQDGLELLEQAGIEVERFV